jgi:hypothetical protein
LFGAAALVVPLPPTLSFVPDEAVVGVPCAAVPADADDWLPLECVEALTAPFDGDATPVDPWSCDDCDMLTHAEAP